MQNNVLSGSLIAIGLVVAGFLWLQGVGKEQEPSQVSMVKEKAVLSSPPPATPTPPVRIEPRSRYVLDVVLHSAEEITQMLDKAEELATKPRSANDPASIAMILHGPEIDIFSIRNYEKYKNIVDRAAKLDAYNIVEVKMCMTAMRNRGIRNEDVPGFIELVPYGPDEIKKLQEKGFVKL